MEAKKEERLGRPDTQATKVGYFPPRFLDVMLKYFC